MEKGITIHTYKHLKNKKKRAQYYLAVKAKSEQHKKEKSCPERCQWHQSHSLGVGYEGQTWTCMLKEHSGRYNINFRVQFQELNSSGLIRS